MDERTGPSAAFALRLSADLLTAIMAAGAISRRTATALVDDSLNAVLQSHPEHEPALREIAATLTAQVELVATNIERNLGEGG